MQERKQHFSEADSNEGATSDGREYSRYYYDAEYCISSTTITMIMKQDPGKIRMLRLE